MSIHSFLPNIESGTDRSRATDHMGIPIRGGGRRAEWDWPSLERLLEKHRAGMKNSDIGAEYGVSGEQVRQLIQRAKKREAVYVSQGGQTAPSTPWAGAVFGDLPVRVCNSLLAAGLVSVEDLRRAHAEARLDQIPNLGRDRVRVEQWLSRQPHTK